MLLFQDEKEVILEALGLIVGAAGHGDRLALAWCCALFDEVLDIVVVDVVCAHIYVSGSASLERDLRRKPLHHLAARMRSMEIVIMMVVRRCETHMHSRPGWTAGGAFVRISWQSMVGRRVGESSRGKLADEASVMRYSMYKSLAKMSGQVPTASCARQNQDKEEVDCRNVTGEGVFEWSAWHSMA